MSVDISNGVNSLNFANGRWAAMSRELGLYHPECFVDYDARDLLRAAMRIANTAPAPIEGCEYGGPGTGTCRVIEPTFTTEYFQRRALELVELAREAIKLGNSISVL